MTRRLAFAVAAVASVLALSSCTIQTANAPTGKVHLIATFDDVQQLLIGHNVQVANVPVGSVQKIELDGFRARVTMSILDGRNIPVGTRAVIKRTSLLGEHFVDLVYPASFNSTNGPFLKDGDVITQTDEQPDFEDLVHQAAAVIGSVTANDVQQVIEAGYKGIGGKGQELHDLVGELAQVTKALAGQQDKLAATVDGLGQLGSALAAGSPQIGTLVDDLAATSQTLAANRDRIVQTLQSLVDLAQLSNDTVLGPHAQALHDLIVQVDPLLQSLAEGRSTLEQLIPNVVRFTELIQQAIRHDDLLVLAWLFTGTPSGTAAGMTTQSSGDPVQTILDVAGPNR
jgi:phospholipid/cholesterol/gamma-HCH transport system substrate-binding protein